MSSYESDLELAYSIEHTSFLSATANNKVVENLYTNRSNNVRIEEKQILKQGILF